MTQVKKIEVYSAGCPVCIKAIEELKSFISKKHQLTIHDMNQHKNAAAAQELNIKRVPALVIDDKLASCCKFEGFDRDLLTGLGVCDC